MNTMFWFEDECFCAPRRFDLFLKFFGRSLRQRKQEIYARSPRMRRASWTSFGMMVTRLAWMAHKLVSSKRPTRYASDASWSARTAEDWNRKSVLKSCAISRTRRWNGSLRIKSSVDFWYLRISRSATVPGRYLCGFLTPPVAGADLRAALVASCLRGALPPVDLRAVCFVRAMLHEVWNDATGTRATRIRPDA